MIWLLLLTGYIAHKYKSVLVVKRAYVRVMLSDEASHVFCIDFSVMRTVVIYRTLNFDQHKYYFRLFDVDIG